MFIGSRTYVHNQSKQIVRPGRTGSPLEADWESAWGGLRNSLTLLRSLLLLVILTLGTTTAWGQTGTNRSGIFYFANGGSGKTYNPYNDPAIANISNPDDYFYLVPADNPQQDNKRDAWFSSDYSTAIGDSEKPYLTTYKTKKDAAEVPTGVTNRPHNSVWIVKFASTDSGTDYYNIIHAATGKYVVYEPPYSNNWNRKSVHLQDSPVDDALFAITTHRITINSINYDTYNFRPKNIGTGNSTNKYLNAANANTNYYYSSENNTEGAADYFRGLVGLYKDAGGGSDWKPEATILDAPAISAVDANNKVTITDANSLPSGYEIRYTTDGSTEPTASTGEVYSGPISITASVTIKAVVVRYDMVLTEVASETREPAPCATPDITFDYTTSKVSIECATDGSTIYYTTDGSTPTTSSTPYSNSFLVDRPTTVKAIATRATFAPSAVAELAISQVATPTIQNNGSNAISITTTTPDATIYYTTDGSTPTPGADGTFEYTDPLTENVSNVTIKAIAVKENMITSAVGSGTVMLQCATPVITRNGMTFTLSCSFPTDANLYYKLDGGSEMTYSGTPVSFTSDQLPMTLTAVARHNNYTQSETASFELLNGTGTPADPYLIYSATDFTNFVSKVNEGTTSSACYKLEIDVSGSGIDAITMAFTGTFDGGMHTISNLGHALFNTVNGGVVKNVILDNVSISGGTNVGAICNEATGDARIYNCGILATNSSVEKDDDGYDQISSSSSTISGSGYVGGIVGLLDGTSRVINCFSYADVSGGSYVGGIVGYNNVASTNPATDLKTMVMNCMFYGEVSGSSIAPIYNGEIITNIKDDENKGVGNYNYFRLEASYVQPTGVTYNCALGAEDRYLQRFEFFRNLLNSHRELAGWWATGTYSSSEMMKWVLEPSQIGTAIPYPILKKPGRYHSVVNIDNLDVVTQRSNTIGTTTGTLTVNIQMGDGAVYQRPSNAAITTSQLMLNITDKDPDHFNFNYHKVQLPYYNDVGTKNYNGNRVVTGWKIVSISGGTPGSFTTGDDAPAYNFADRNCTNKDLYGTNGSNRIFNQGAYWDVPEGVTAITIEPYWAKCVYLADPNADKVYDQAMTNGYDVPNVGGGTIYTNGNSYSIAGENQVVYTSIGDAIASTALYAGYTDEQRNNHSVYDYAVVLVGNYHHYFATNKMEASKSKPYTVTSIDLDRDNEPDYSYILRFDGRAETHPVRADFINIPGLGMAQKSTGGKGSYNFGILIPKGWYESTNTSLLRFTQFEYEHSSRSETDAIIVQGGVMEQWVSNNQKGTSNKIPYIHVGGNVWFKEFHTGCHQDKQIATKHSPISVTGGDYDEFYLTGLYRGDFTSKGDNAECYINGGRFGTICGAAMEGIGKANGADKTGDITWLIQNADIKEFYAGGLNAAKPVTGNLSTTIIDSHVDIFCGGPKFGDMSANKTVVTNATGCTFGTFFGAGYGGNSYSRDAPRNHNNIVNFPHNDGEGAGNHASWNAWLADKYKKNYDAAKGGISTQFDYQFLPMSNNTSNVARIFVDYVAFSLATTHNVTSSLEDCTITGNFYGGGSLGKVEGDVTSTLTNCTVNGSVFGAGYSASLPTVEVMDVGFQTEPWYYEDLGTYRTGVLPTKTTTTYHWEQVTATEFSSKQVDNTHHILYTTADLTALGTVTGTATLTIDGSTTVVGESVYGGGEESSVGGDTEVTVNNGIIGTQGQGATDGNVYGGGKGKFKDEDDNELEPSKAVELGLVKGNTNVTIAGGEIKHNVYGGGAFGSVGTYTYATDNSGKITDYTSGGTANVTITGGTIGTDGINNGMVFGSSRGDIDEPGSIHDRLAWVHDTHVIIGTSGQGTTLTTPLIKGSVYGSGENGHTYQNTIVDVHSGTIGVPTGANVVVHDPDDPENGEKDVTYAAYNYPYRGNVYGGGCGTDKYYDDPTGIVNPYDGNGDTYNPLAGIVLGTTQVNIDGGLVVHNVYGAGAMGSVGITDNTGAITGGGSTTVTISGGIVGVTVTVDNDHPEPTGGNVFGAARGDADYPERGVAQVKSTSVSMSNGIVYGNVYGGGALGDVGTYTNTYTDSGSKNYVWDKINNIEIGDCAVEISGGTVWGHVFGGGKGDASTFECEKAMVRKTDVSISAGTVHGSVYGGGEIGRVDQDTKVTLGVENAESGTSAPVIAGDVFGAGAGKETHGYSALVRGNAEVIVQGKAEIAKSVYGGGEIAAVGRYGLDGDNMPTNLVSGGECKVTVKGYAKIGPVNGGNVVGAGKGVNPMDAAHNYINYTTLSDKTTKPKRMTLKPAPEKMPDLYDNVGDGSQYIWEYYTSEENYFKFLQTLALATDTKVSIEGNATVNGNVYGGSESGFVQRETDVKIQGACVIGTKDTDGNITTEGDIYGSGKGLSGFAEAGRVSGGTTVTINGGTTNGSVYGGGELGIVKGAVLVNVNDGTIEKDVYGGGALANTNTNNWNGSTLSETYLEVGGLTVGESSVVGYYEESSGSYTEVTSGTAATGKKYYRKVNTTVNLLGGEIHGDAYGGGLGQWGTGVHFTQEEIDAATEGQPAYNKKTSDWKVKPADGTGNIKAMVYGNVFVTLGTLKASAEDTNPTTATAFNIRHLNSGTEEEPNQVVSSGRVFGCNNLNGSPQGDVTVKVNKTVTGKLNGATNTRTNSNNLKIENATHTYEVAAVYGGGNLADFTTTASGKKTWVRIETCDVSIEEVYGGGNAAEVPATDVLVNGAYEIEEVFGGGNGKDPYTTDDGTSWVENPGANIGNATHSGSATTLMTGGLIHAAYGGSNKKGTIFGSVSIDIGEGGDCTLDLEKMVGAGKDADVNGDLIMVLGCKPGETIPVVYGGADNAHVNGNVELTITSGIYENVFGGNNAGGYILGHIKLNIEERDCDTPIRIDHLYLGGNEAAYSMYGYYNAGTVESPNPQPRTAEMIDPTDATHYKEVITKINGVDVRRQPDTSTQSYAQPELNVISCTYIGEVFGGGYGTRATLYGDPIVNINMVPGPKAATNITGGNDHSLGEIRDVFGGGNQAKVEGSTVVNIGTATKVEMTSLPKVHAEEGDPEYDEDLAADAQPMVYQKETVEGAYITGNVYGGGNEADVTGNTYVNVCAVKDNAYDTDDVIGYKSVTISGTDFEGVTIKGNVFGGGKGVTEDAGVTGAFECVKAMVGNNGDNDGKTDIMKESTDKGTRVSIGNGTIEGSVYGGGQVGRVEWNGVVTIGLPVGSGETSAPEIKGDVFGGGKGVEQYGYAALMRGNTFVTVQANAKVGKSVYGGGEIASVGRYKVATEDDINNTTFMAAHPGIEKGMPYSLANEESGYCNVIVRGNAEIGPDNMKMYYANGKAPDDEGHVFGAGKGVLPYENEATFKCQASGHNGAAHPGRMGLGNVWECYNGQEAKYLRFIETQALATHTEVLVDEDAFVKGSVYGGSLSGHVQHDTHVTIAGDCQIGAGFKDEQSLAKYTNWPTDNITESWAACAHWEFDENDDAPYDPYAIYPKEVNDKVRYYYDEECTEANYANGGSKIAKNGQTYYGNVYGGGSGVVPYKPGKWHREAGSVGGNAVVDITGGHILTSVYGGNECTDVGTYDPSTRNLLAGTGKCTVNMIGGTVGVPRISTDIKNHPMISCVYGGGKGDPRVNFNKWTNVGETEVNITENARIYGSVFGGGEDGHVLGDAETNIGGSVTIGTTDHDYPTTFDASNPGVIIGSQGQSGADGNVFGGGRGFSEEALTAGVVCGNVTLNIHNGKMLGTVYGGGRLASVGTHLADAGTALYGKLISEGYNQVIGSTDVAATGATHGHIQINIDGGAIGATDGNGKLLTSSSSIGDVFGGCKGSGNNKHFGLAKHTEINMTGGTVNGTVYGGGELGYVGEAKLNSSNVYEWNEEAAGGGLCTVGISGGTVAGNVFGAGKGLADDFDCEKALVRTTSVTINKSSATGTTVSGNVYGGGEVGRVDQNTVVTIGNSTGESGGTDAVISGSVFGAGAGVETHGYSALVRGNATVTIQGNANVRHNVYGGGEIASVGQYGLDSNFMPETLKGGGDCIVNVKGYAVIGESGEGHVFGAGKGVNPFDAAHKYIDYTDSTDKTTKPKRMTKKPGEGKPWPALYENVGDGSQYIWEYYTSQDDYFKFLQTLALATDSYATIEGNASVHGNVYGGSESGFVQRETDVKIQGDSKILTVTDTENNTTTDGNVFGGGRGVSGFDKAGRVRGNATTTISGSSTVNGNVYGGGELGFVGKFSVSANGRNYDWQNITNQAGTEEETGTCTVIINSAAAEVKGDVFGAGKGEAITFKCEPAMTRTTSVSINNGTVGGNVYGGGEVGRVDQDTRVTIGAETGDSAPHITNSVFGAGAGLGTHGYSALVRGNTYVTVQNHATVGHSVYGGGEIASVGKYGLDEQKMPSVLLGGGYCYVTVKDDAAITGDVFGAGQGITPAFDKDNSDRSKRSRRMTMYSSTDFPSSAMISAETGTASGTTTQRTTWEYYESGSPYVWEYFQKESDYLTYLETLALATHPEVTIEGNASIGNDVYGGGERGITKGSVIVNINGGTIARDVYGGGALANTNTTSTVGVEDYYTAEVTTNTVDPTTTVNLHGGIIGHNVYGGGLGQKHKDAVAAAPAQGTEGQEDYVPAVEAQDEVPAIAALVYGDVLVKLNEKPTVTEGVANFPDNCVVKGVIHGANNYNGSPQGDVTVHVYKTQGWSGHDVTEGKNNETIDKDDRTYELKAVYGGGNEAAYDPIEPDTRVAHVIIDGCNLTSIQTVYGGGNAAAAPATHVEVNGCYEIGTVFAGGNGRDAMSDGSENPGADVGYKPNAAGTGKVSYGTGEALAEIHGGFVHSAFGGSNTKGNVRESATVQLSEFATDDPRYCSLGIDEAYGAGNEAEQDGTSNIDLGCLSYLRELYGGAKNADVNNDIVLNIQSGRFHRVFGGNNIGGRINGTITVNVEETGCHPIIIGQLFGGGNQAGYSVYGYKAVNEKWVPRESSDDDGTGPTPPYRDPQVNVKSFTSIGEIYGGGYGESALMVGNPTVDINVCEGDNRNVEMQDDPNDVSKNTGEWIHIKKGEEVEDNVVKSIYDTVWQPEHKSGAIGTIGNVFGGGNAAPVHGNTNVIIGDKNTVLFVTPKKKTVTTNGVTSEVDTTDQERTHTVIGANITGNVYGGGNAADVSGDTNVVIGKEKTTTTTTP